MFEIVKCAFYGFIFFAFMMLISGIMEYQTSAKDVDELINNDGEDVSYEIDI